MNIANPAAALSFDDMILSQGREISRKLNLLRHENFPPDARKNMLRQFSMAEAAYFLGVSPSNLKKLHLEGKGVEPTILTGGRRAYSVEQIQELRQRSEEHTSELQSRENLVCRLLLEKKRQR